jgi:hypothetical protein
VLIGAIVNIEDADQEYIIRRNRVSSNLHWIKTVTKLVIILQPPGVCFIDLLRRHELLVDKSKRVGATYYPSFILIRNPVAPELQDLVSIIFLSHSVSLFGEGYV